MQIKENAYRRMTRIHAVVRWLQSTFLVLNIDWERGSVPLTRACYDTQGILASIIEAIQQILARPLFALAGQSGKLLFAVLERAKWSFSSCKQLRTQIMKALGLFGWYQMSEAGDCSRDCSSVELQSLIPGVQRGHGSLLSS